MQKLQDMISKVQLDKKKIIAIALVTVLFLYVDIAFLLKFQIKAAAGLGSKVVKMRKEITELKEQISGMDTEKAKQTQMISKAKNIINDSQKDELIKEIYDTANARQVKVMQLRPLSEGRNKEEVTVNRVKLTAVSISADLSCGYHEFGSFLNALENGKYYIQVSDIRIARSPNDNFHHNVTMVLKTYVKK